jgi:serine/threonine-protein kinase
MRQEARASARVNHPNIVALHDMGDHPELGLFLVFEYIRGETLKDRLERGPVGPAAVARLAREVGSALATAHAAGVLHRDIKPENIMLCPTGAKVADFGIARVPDSTLTFGGGLLGTPAYSAPEALSDAKFSPQSDQFSFAATLYEALSGRRAFPGDDAMAVAARIQTEDPPRIAAACGVDVHVDTILARGLLKYPRGRFDTCEELGNALAEALELSPRTAMPTLPDRMHQAAADEMAGSRNARAMVLGLVVGVALTLGVYQLAGLGDDESEALLETSAHASALPSEDPAPVAWLAERPAEGNKLATRVSAVGARTRGLPRDGGPDATTGDGGADGDAGLVARGPASKTTGSRDGGAPRKAARRTTKRTKRN